MRSMVLGLRAQLVLLLGVAAPCGVEGHGRHRRSLLTKADMWNKFGTSGFEFEHYGRMVHWAAGGVCRHRRTLSQTTDFIKK